MHEVQGRCWNFSLFKDTSSVILLTNENRRNDNDEMY